MKPSSIISILCTIVTVLLLFLMSKAGFLIFIAVFFGIIAIITGIVGHVKTKNMGSKIVMILGIAAFVCSAGYMGFMIMLSGI